MNHVTDPIVYLAFQVIPRAHHINNYELVDCSGQVKLTTGIEPLQ